MEWLFNVTTLTIATGVLILLNLGILIWLFRLSKHYNSLVKGLDKKSLMSALEGIQKTLASHERNLASQKKDIHKIEEDGQLHLQKLTLKRFNPFSDTGGDQSFILSLLDAHKDGIIITSLHSRENTRFYVKSIKDGDGVDHPLSKEEQKVVNS